MDYVYKLSLAAMIFPKGVLSAVENVVFFKVLHQMICSKSLHEMHVSDTGLQLIGTDRSFFLNSGHMLAFFHSLDIDLMSMDCWKK